MSLYFNYEACLYLSFEIYVSFAGDVELTDLQLRPEALVSLCFMLYTYLFKFDCENTILLMSIMLVSIPGTN